MTESRRYIIQFSMLLAAVAYAVRLFVLQVSSEEYRIEARDNTVQRYVDPALRGLIYDRNGELLVSNSPVFDIKIIARELEIKDSLRFCKLLGLEQEQLRSGIANAKEGIRRYRRTLLVKQLSHEHYAKIQEELSDYPGVYVEPRTIREYHIPSMAHALGYVREIDRLSLQRDTSDYYRIGDMIGKSGIEAVYEDVLRGKRGTRYVMVDARNTVKGSYADGKYDTLPEAGKDLHLTIDLSLQNYGEELMANKVGSIVAIEPKTGQILSMISAPTYNPALLSGEGHYVSQNFQKLLNNKYKPLFNRAGTATYPPGSTFKLVHALVGMEDGVIDAEHTRFSCAQELIGCHSHPSPLSVRSAVKHSCNPFFFQAFNRMIRKNRSENDFKDTRIGLDEWKKDVTAFGLGSKLGSDVYSEKGGLIPSSEYYDKRFKNRRHGWRLNNIYSLSIGQGEVLTSPLQLANVAAVIANKGHFFTPHLLRDVQGGDNKNTDSLLNKFREPNYTNVASKHFDVISRAMSDVVRSGTATSAYNPEITICGKTGTVQNPQGEDHSVFIAYAPQDDPQIAIAVYIENAGAGGAWAAPVAGLMIEKYINKEVKSRLFKDQEKRVLAANLIEQHEFFLKNKKRKRKKAPEKNEQPKIQKLEPILMIEQNPIIISKLKTTPVSNEDGKTASLPRPQYDLITPRREETDRPKKPQE